MPSAPITPRRFPKFFALMFAAACPVLLAQPRELRRRPRHDNSPTDWIDPVTGHRIIRLSTEPGSTTLYFHDNSYSPEGDKLIFSSPSGIAMVDLATLGSAPPDTKVIVPGGRSAYMARRTREVYFQRGAAGAAASAEPTASLPAPAAIGRPWPPVDREVQGAPAVQAAGAGAAASEPDRSMRSITTPGRPASCPMRPAP